MLGAIARGTTCIRNANAGKDVTRTVAALRQLGVRIERAEHVFFVHGTDALHTPKGPIDCGNSGTTMRLLAGLLAGRADAILDGDRSLRRRPMARLVEPLRQMGAQVACSRAGLPPVRVAREPQLHGGRVRLDVPSAQVESAVMLAALNAARPTTMESPWLVRDHTPRMLRDFGARITVRGNRTTLVPTRPRSPGRIDIRGDLSAAVYFLCMAAVVPGSRLLLRDVGVNPSRAAILSILRAMGVAMTIRKRRHGGSEPSADVQVRGGSTLRTVTIPKVVVPQIIDEIPALCALAAAIPGTFAIRGAAELRHKESDRIQTIGALLASFGVRHRLYADGLSIRGGAIQAPKGVRTFGDHRIGMAAAVLAAAARAPITILDCACIETSFPGFAQTWRAAF